MAENTLHDSVSAAFDQVAAATPPEPPTPAAPPTSLPPATTSLSEPGESPAIPADTAAGEPGAEPAGGRQRDAHGRFLPKESTDKLEATPAPEVAPKAAEPAAPAPAAAPAEFGEAPQSWAPEKRTDWAKVPPEIRGYLHQREGELQQGFQRVAQRATVAESILSEFMPYADVLEKEGATPVTAIRTLLQTAHALRTGGQEYRKAILMSLAQQYGVDLAQPYNPELAKTQAELQALSTEKLYGTTQQTIQQTQQIQQQFDAFANDPKNEFFPKVRQLMGQLISGGVAADLQSAYDMALGMHPEVRKEVFNREFATREAAQRKATVAGMSVSGAPNGAAAPAPNSPMNLRDTIAKAFEGAAP